MSSTTRQCSTCERTKPLTEFSRDNTKKSGGGFTTQCLECRRAYFKGWYFLNKEKQIARVLANRKRQSGELAATAGEKEKPDRAETERQGSYVLIYLSFDQAERFKIKLKRQLKRQPSKEEFEKAVRRVCYPAIETAIF